MLTAAGVAAICLTVAGLQLAFIKKFKRKDMMLKLAAVLMTVGGLGIGGLVGRWLRQAGVWLTENLSDVGTQLIGYGLPLVISLVIIGWFAIDMAKGHKPSKFTPWLGLLQFPIAAPLLPGAAGDKASLAGEQVFSAVQAFLIAVVN